MMIKKTFRYWRQGALLAAAFFGGIFGTQADTSLRGTLIANPPCDVYGDNNPIQVNFGEVGITRIDGINYAQPFTLTVACGSTLGNNVALVLHYIGVDAQDFNTNALQTTKPGLGILLTQNGSVMPPIFPPQPNTGLSVSMSSNGQLNIPFMAVPVKNMDASTVLLEGDFSASASMEIQYP